MDTQDRQQSEPVYPDAPSRRRVLVAVMNNKADMQRAASEGWYRIPQRRAPRRLGADYLAFYQTGAFKGEPEAQTITFYAPIRRYHLLTRRQLLLEESDHARADDYYFRIDIGPLRRLESPVPSATMRRITFIHTTFDCLCAAQDVRDLFVNDDPFEKLWQALRENRLRPLKNRLVDGWPLDITLRARGGHLGIYCQDEDTPSATNEHPFLRSVDRWELLWLSTTEIEQDMPRCLRRIGSALINLGGSNLNQS